MNSIIQATSLRINKPAIPAVEENKLRTEIRNYILFFIFALVISGVTAFPIETELAFIYNHISFFPLFLQEWISKVYFAVETTNEHYPFLSYGTDWLAFAHLVIATAFLGPLLNPVKNIWVIQWGMIACIGIFPLAFIAGPIRGIPFFHQLIDCSFGVFGFILLFICCKKIVMLEIIQQAK